jgi:probable rRNA maturation factor
MRAGVEHKIEVQIGPGLADFAAADLPLTEQLRAVVKAVLDHEGWRGELALVLTDDDSIQALNRDFLGVDAPTDVLSFAAQEDGGPFVTGPDAESYLGDVIVSYPRAVEQAKEEGHNTEQELNLLIVHGVLHLLGYDHARDEEQAVMWARQEAILRGL